MERELLQAAVNGSTERTVKLLAKGVGVNACPYVIIINLPLFMWRR